MEIYSMSKKQIDQAQFFKLLELKCMTQSAVSEVIDLSERQIRRKQKNYKINGAASLIHKGKGKPSNRRTSDEIVEKILELMKTKYAGFGPTLAAEKLLSEEKIKIDHDVLRKI